MNVVNAGGMVICRPEPIVWEGRRGTVVTLDFMSDLHIGANHVDYNKIKSDIVRAVKAQARLNILGDVLDLILVQDKKRFRPDVLHPKLQGRSNIVNEAVTWAADILEPAVDLIDVIMVGNHEVSVEKYNNFDPTQALIYELEKRSKTGHKIIYGGYTGFIDYRVRKKGKEKSSSGGFRYVIYYHHGSGAYAPVTKGLIDFNRKDTFIDADLIWLGHKHNKLTVAVEKLSCPMQGWAPNVKDVRHLMTGAYFNTYAGQTQESIRQHGRRSNYAADLGLAPQGKGGARIELVIGASGGNTNGENLTEVRVIQ